MTKKVEDRRRRKKIAAKPKSADNCVGWPNKWFVVVCFNITRLQMGSKCAVNLWQSAICGRHLEKSI